MGIEISHMATDPYCALDNSRLRTGMVCCGSFEEIVESSSWHWIGNLRSRSGAIHLWLVDVKQRKEEEEIK